ncbi:response regulator [Piscinibacter sp. Jin2]|uniref:histidine kinase n=1 Tax=Aquariibacter lacus TaxID=2801332 RepID=A0A9X1BP03_9BURK|nr:hybrid sensor histidine kinase/response regulator [Piscinibacter lacus]MBL0720810.1 response regulator [Piscinibacter lacus]
MKPGEGPEGLPAPEDETFLSEARLLPDKVSALYAQVGVSLFGNLLGALVVFAIYLPTTPAVTLWGWAGIFSIVWLTRLALRGRYEKTSLGARAAEAPLWLRRWNVSVMASGVVWGLAPWLLYSHGSALSQTALIIIVYSYAVGSITLLAPQFRIFASFIVLALLPLIARVAIDPQHGGPVLAGVLGLAFAMTATLGSVYRATFERTIRLKVRTEALAEQLRAEKAVAEQARRAAETASRAKTQFLAAASHDLRQPLHALGLFAEALRARTQGQLEVVSLVNSINSSVEALEALFGELLDLSKIDSGVVEPVPAHFACAQLFSRLRLQYAPIAFEKGLALRFRGHQHAFFADPVLVDRIVRNLLANAIRYTEDGGVLVAARRRGDQVRIEVWDSGVGISPVEQDRIFDEFYQAPGRPALAPQERKGLGLGLAIVRRLSRLMAAPVGLRSWPGRGSVFHLSLPAGRLPPDRPPPPLPGPRAELTLAGRSILVVEDEAAVRDSLRVLLQGWEAQVELVDSLAGLEAWLALASTQGKPRPDLLLVDYRLPDGNGLQVLKRLRAQAGLGELPALMITGSTLGGQEDQAEALGFHLLTKPVSPQRLRAMISFKLGRKGAPPRVNPGEPAGAAPLPPAP